MENYWTETAIVLGDALAITWDNCHKIYVLMDENQIRKSEGYGYEIVRIGDRGQALATLMDWYENSCGLKFIEAISSTGEEFTTIIPQGLDWEEEYGLD